MTVPVTWADLSDLLHDARLTRLAWRPAAADASLTFHCLRRNTDGSAISDPSVRVVISGVVTLGVAYDATCRPSEFTPQRLLTTTDLRGWDCGDEPFIWLNKPDHETRFLDALQVEWFAGCAENLPNCPFRLGLAFGYGLPPLSVLIGAQRLEAFAGREPLSLELWAAQYNAWWAGWTRHWDAKRENTTSETAPVREDLAIPIGADPPPDPAYRWPDEPIVEWEPTDVPTDVLAAVASWFATEAQSAGKPVFGEDRRFYARQIDSWWIEGNRGSATVRGIEHTQPSGSVPVRTVECVQECLLRRREIGWVVEPQSRAWPPYGSAPARPASEKPWLARWRSGFVLSERGSATA